MALVINGILFDELTSDPGTPAEGQMWYNTTDDQIKIYRNGAIISLVDRDVHDAHALDVSTNPHEIDLDAAIAEQGGSPLSSGFDLGGNDITNVGGTGAGYNAASETYVTEQINAKLRGLDWQESVLDKDLSTPPGSPGVGDRYIVASGGTGDWSGKDGYIAEWDGTQWVFSIAPNEGFATRVEDEDLLYIHDGTSWGQFGSAVDHGSLLGLSDDDHTQYLLVSGARSMSGDLNMGGNSISNVNLVDGVDVSAHASRHIDGGADVIDGDKAEISWIPTNYTRTTSPAEVDALDQLTAHLAGIDLALGVGGGGALDHKAGTVLAASFTGTPRKATVTFTTPFADTNYAVVVTATTSNNKHWSPDVESKGTNSFIIALGSNGIADLIAVDWIAMKHGEGS